MACQACRPDLRGSAEKRNEGHLSSRFGDAGKRVSVDGREVTRECYEAQLGDPGWALCFKRNREGGLACCDCGKGANSERLVGKVELVV